ncbi:hypothetical protein CLAFUW4_02545 [Fulvia fulva]|uniref:Uncharacterized protein n=1 Tax=Passalora fulva TaxID=5499 RepID=A0A9Q8L9I2_PASFU|nr:uncharacterized protein CLAFUR5_02534 [Fulvia fulva]KAK4631573.1 hypothetical protein CLAFUR4_02540 [Fulvia fulva]KAK4632835.1 hypothetical protein CLAFUR0_02544 [Fulvia fulva]UJO13294.1 hypothetical protein CLAFUR5_02534 [Fulvia fulva]WPV11089.1 hypothetical protein CLAFUW4_02545 [Fulvia fulva]WPV26862.1 hypothetical protein CLAFUW7_02545 [Fulvia fulva]
MSAAADATTASSAAMPQSPAPAILPARETSYALQRPDSQASKTAPISPTLLRSPSDDRVLLPVKCQYNTVKRYWAEEKKA